LRITNGILTREALSGMQSQMRALDAARQQATTGKKVSRPSDDPVSVSGIMQSSTGLRALDQYRRNLETGQSRLSIEDSVLDQVSNAMIRAKELAVSQAGDTATAATRQATKAEIDGLIDFVTDLANTKLAGSFVFGGQYADAAPYVGGLADPSKPPSGSLKMEIGAGLFVETNHSAQEIFIDSDAVDSLKALSTALGSDDIDGVRTSMSRIDTSFQSVQELVGDLGARMSRLDISVSNLDSLEVTLQTFRSGLADADLAEAVTELVSRQGSLQAAMLANSRILNITLTDYLR
jgi:flagellar hook-associated protein 3 FlgL